MRGGFSQGYTFNGGGAWESNGSWNCQGGGATDIRLSIGDGKWDNTIGLNSRIMVAAGGGRRRTLGK